MRNGQVSNVDGREQEKKKVSNVFAEIASDRRKNDLRPVSKARLKWMNLSEL